MEGKIYGRQPSVGNAWNMWGPLYSADVKWLPQSSRDESGFPLCAVVREAGGGGGDVDLLVADTVTVSPWTVRMLRCGALSLPTPRGFAAEPERSERHTIARHSGLYSVLFLHQDDVLMRLPLRLDFLSARGPNQSPVGG